MQIREERLASLDTLMAGATVLVIPGWNGSGDGHWQTLWELKYARFRRVVQHNRERPTREGWVERIDADLDRLGSRAFLVAHSLGCLAVAHWATTDSKKTGRVTRKPVA
jgi:predicted alpha/beta hydrolase family esterase